MSSGVSMWAVARRPRWIGALILALAIAAAFAALGQWQLERSITSGEIVTRDTEAVRALADIAQAGDEMSAVIDGQRVSVDGTFVGDDFIVLSNRIHDGDSGFWVTGHLITDDGDIAVALGWAGTVAEAEAVATQLAADAGAPVSLTGRYVGGEGPQQTDYVAGELQAMAPSAFVNLWSTLGEDGTYAGYLIDEGTASGLLAIDAPPPSSEIEVNWLNIFYAAEWVVFAGFAVYLWYRLVRDQWELEQHAAADPDPVT